MKKQVFLFIFSSLCVMLGAQNRPQIYLNAEAMTGGSLSGSFREEWPVKQTPITYVGFHSTPSSDAIFAEGSMYCFSLKPEFRFSRSFSLYTGLRLTTVQSSFAASTRSGFFFLRTSKQHDTNTEFFRIRSIEEQVHYLSIPLEMTVAPWDWKRFRLYGKLGADVGLKISSNHSVDFQFEEMRRYEKEVLNAVIPPVSRMLSNIYGAVGFAWEFTPGWAANIDLPMVRMTLTEGNSSILQFSNMTTFVFSLTMPLFMQHAER